MGGPPIPIAEPRVAMTMSEKPARLAWPAKEGPETIATVGDHPESSAIPSNKVNLPICPLSSK